MIDPIRSLIREDVEASYQDPAPDLTRRAFRMVATGQPERRSNLQALALTAALVLVAVAVLVARGTHLWPLSQEATRGGGLLPPLASYSIVDNQFVSASTGWILIQMHTTSGPLVLLKTSDGGAHWVEQFRYTGKGGINTIHFSSNGLDGTMSWLEGGGGEAVPVGSTPAPAPAPAAPQPTVLKTYQTHDGGAHWILAFQVVQDNPVKPQPPPAYTPAFASPTSFLDNDREGWQLRLPFGANPKGDGLVMHTTDSGRTWTQVGVLPGTLQNSQLTFLDSENGFVTVDQSRTFAFDAKGNPMPTVTAPALIYITHDGGHTWVAASIQLPPSAAAANTSVSVNQPVMLDASQGILVMQVMTGPSGPANPQAPLAQTPSVGYILRTSDGGDHWGSLQALPPALAGGGLFLSETHWLAGSGAFLNETTDGGKTWSKRRVLADGLTFDLGQWDYISPSLIWSQVGAGGLIRSTDGGRTWEAITPPTVH